MENELKSIRMPVIGREVQQVYEDYFAVFDPAVDQLIRTFYDDTNAHAAITLLADRLLSKSKASASHLNENAIRNDIN